MGFPYRDWLIGCCSTLKVEFLNTTEADDDDDDEDKPVCRRAGGVAMRKISALRRASRAETRVASVSAIWISTFEFIIAHRDYPKNDGSMRRVFVHICRAAAEFRDDLSAI